MALNILSFKENISSIVKQLRSQLDKFASCEGKPTFVEAVKQLATMYHPYFYCPTYQISYRLFVDIQAELETCERNIHELEKNNVGLYNVVFTLRSLGKAIERLETSLDILYKEIQGFWNLLVETETQNKSIKKILKDIWRVLTNLKEAQFTLTKQQKQFIIENLENNLASFTNYISSSYSEELDSLLKSLSNKSMYFSESIRQIKNMNNVIGIHKDLKNIHPTFSYYLILLINQGISKTEITNIKSRFSCFKRKTQSKDVVKTPTDNLADHVHSILTWHERSLLVVGKEIYQLNKGMRDFYCGSLRREEILIATIQSKQMVLFRGLNEIHNIMMALNDMEEDNDILVGKLAKCRPRFATINNLTKVDIDAVINALKENEKNQSQSTLTP